MANLVEDEDLREALRSIDQIVGTKYRDLAIKQAREDSHQLQITGTCRKCSYVAHAEVRIAPGFGERIILDFLKKVKMHDDTHLIVLPGRE